MLIGAHLVSSRWVIESRFLRTKVDKPASQRAQQLRLVRKAERDCCSRPAAAAAAAHFALLGPKQVQPAVASHCSGF